MKLDPAANLRRVWKDLDLEDAWHRGENLAEFLPQGLIQPLSRSVDRSDNQILQHLRIIGIRSLRLDHELRYVPMPIHLDGNHTAADRDLRKGHPELALHLALNLFGLLEQLVRVHYLFPLARR